MTKYGKERGLESETVWLLKNKKGWKEVGGVGRRGNDGKLLGELHCFMQIKVNTMQICCNSFFLF